MLGKVLSGVLVLGSLSSTLVLMSGTFDKRPASSARYGAPTAIAEAAKDESADTFKVLTFLRATDVDYADTMQANVCNGNLTSDFTLKLAEFTGVSYKDSDRAISIIKDTYNVYECP